MPQLAERLGLNLPDALTRDGEALANFFESVLAAVVQAETHLDHFFFARRQVLQHRFGLFLEVDVDDRLGGRNHAAILDKISRCESSSSPMGVSREIGS